METIKRGIYRPDYIIVNSMNEDYEIRLHMHDIFNLNIACGERAINFILNVVLVKEIKRTIIGNRVSETKLTTKVECYERNKNLRKNLLIYEFIPMYKPLIFKNRLEVIY